jgi:hypothetical protein
MLQVARGELSFGQFALFEQLTDPRVRQNGMQEPLRDSRL